MAKIRELRLTFICMEPFSLERIAASLLGDSQRYLQEYEAARAGKGSWTLPWLSMKSQHFWEYYLEKEDKDSLKASESWRHLVPLRSLPFVTVAKTPGLRLALEGFGYPHGTAVLATAYLKQDLPMFDMVDKAVRVWNGEYQATWQKTGTTARQSLKRLVDQGLELLWTSLGEEAKNRVRPLRRPFTVATVINASGFEVEKSQEPGGEIHRALEGLCILDPSYKHAQLHALDQHCLPLRSISPSMHLLYHLDRSRALWFPYFFEEWCNDYRSENKTIRRLGCYHRNLTLAALQVESLIGLIVPLSKLLKQNQDIPVPLKNLARCAGGIIGRLHGGKQTYRTMSVGRRLEDENILEAMLLVREATGVF